MGGAEEGHGIDRCKDYKAKMFQRRGDGGEGDLPVVWHFSHGENRRGATSVYTI
jgi:hypothetical protein